MKTPPTPATNTITMMIVSLSDSLTAGSVLSHIDLTRIFFVDSYIDNLTTFFLDDIIAEHQVSYKSRVGGCRKGKRKKKMWLAFSTIFRVFFLSKTETDI